MTNCWFGERPVLAIQQEMPRVATPVGKDCLHCDEPIEEGDNGITTIYVGADSTTARALHVECYLRQSIGGVNHIEGRCTCQGGSEPPDPPGMTKREAAIAAVQAWHRVH
jgi:hypothetical protein